MKQHNILSISYFDSIDSTNDYCKRLLAADKKMFNASNTFNNQNANNESGMKSKLGLPFAVCAFEQTGGRGRLGRTWHSPAGGVYLSLALRLEVPKERPESLSSLTPLSALAVHKVLSCYHDAWIKWPNDIVCHMDNDESKTKTLAPKMSATKENAANTTTAATAKTAIKEEEEKEEKCSAAWAGSEVTKETAADATNTTTTTTTSAFAQCTPPMDKLAGILVERVGTADTIIGVGINVFAPNLLEPKNTLPKTVSSSVSNSLISNIAPWSDNAPQLAYLLNKDLFNKNFLHKDLLNKNLLHKKTSGKTEKDFLKQLAAKVIDSLLAHIYDWQRCNYDFSYFVDAYRAQLSSLNNEVVVRNAQGEVLASGKAIDVSASGKLVIQTTDGLIEIATGEVTLRNS